MICKTIALEAVKQDDNLRWLLGLKMIDTLLTDFDFSLQEKCDLLNTLQENFGKEYGITTDFRRQFGQKYRTEKNRIEKILAPNSEQEDEYISLFQPIVENSKLSKNIIEEIKSGRQKAESRKAEETEMPKTTVKTKTSVAEEIQMPEASVKAETLVAESRKELNDLLSSYIHMTFNRLFRTQQRTHELILYDYLYRYYNSIIQRLKKRNET